MDEFKLIQNYFARAHTGNGVVVGIGDDCAIVEVPPMQKLAITTDTLVAGVHFSPETAADDIGYKALAVNLSDLAAMGAQPAWVTLALTLPTADEPWLAKFSEGFFALADHYKVRLIGGDLTHGPLTITLQAHGLVSDFVTRDGANPGDLIYVTNTLGDAGLALRLLAHENPVPPEILVRLNRPAPRIEAGLKLPLLASAAIDISDGLAADLNHILERSRVGAIVYVDKLPLSEALTTAVSSDEAWELALSAGDDYELCFTVPPSREKSLLQELKKINCPCTCIGTITATEKLELQFTDGKKYHGKTQGYQHF
jgi:thiamine-monophosphate kinase